MKLFHQINSDRTIQIELAGTFHSMLFTKTHTVDLKAVINAESALPNPPIF